MHDGDAKLLLKNFCTVCERTFLLVMHFLLPNSDGSEAAADYGRKALWKWILWLRATCLNPKRTSVMPQHTYCRLLLEFHSGYRQKWELRHDF
jgi:hypothetical protein